MITFVFQETSSLDWELIGLPRRGGKTRRERVNRDTEGLSLMVLDAFLLTIFKFVVLKKFH